METKTETFEQRANRERKERQELFASLRLKMDAVSVLLGGFLKPEKEDIDGGVPYNFSAEIVLPDNGGVLWVTSETYQNKKHFHFSGQYPRTKKGEYVRPYGYGETPADSINVSRDKTPEQIAKDVTRRLLPEYKTRLEKVRAQVADYDGYHESQQTAIQTVSQGAGLTFSDHRENGIIQFSFASDRADDGEGNGDVIPLGRGTVKLSLSYLSPAQAVAILELLKAEQ